MSGAVATWLERMRGSAGRPMVRLVVMRDGRTPTYAFDVTEETELDELAARIDAMCENAGFTKFELRALDRDGRTIGAEKVDLSAPRKERNDGVEVRLSTSHASKLSLRRAAFSVSFSPHCEPSRRLCSRRDVSFAACWRKGKPRGTLPQNREAGAKLSRGPWRRLLAFWRRATVSVAGPAAR